MFALPLSAVLWAVPIYGGSEAQTCEWPTTVAMGGDIFCTGFLVHPEIVLYAAHCGPQPEVLFGEDALDPVWTVTTEICEEYDLFDGEVGGSDFAYCRLAEPVDLPITPVSRGCETDAVEVGRDVVIAGYGDTADGVRGVKHWAATTVSEIPVTGIAFLGGDGTGTCFGDSGGPAFIELDDGSWRVFAVTSGVLGGECGQISAHVLLDKVVEWVELMANVDLTSCHDEAGEWHPTPLCTGFPLTPGSGSWDSGCAAGQRSGKAASCGPPFAETPDGEPPTVTITTPADGDTHSEAPVEIRIDVEADDHDGSGVRHVWLEIDGNPVLRPDETTPYWFYDVELGAGARSIVAWAEDWSGNVGSSMPVEVEVGPIEGTEDSGSPSDADAGCACRAGRPGYAPALVLFVVGIWGRRRNRSSVLTIQGGSGTLSSS